MVLFTENILQVEDKVRYRNLWTLTSETFAFLLNVAVMPSGTRYDTVISVYSIVLPLLVILWLITFLAYSCLALASVQDTHYSHYLYLASSGRAVRLLLNVHFEILMTTAVWNILRFNLCTASTSWSSEWYLILYWTQSWWPAVFFTKMSWAFYYFNQPSRLLIFLDSPDSLEMSSLTSQSMLLYRF